MGSSGVARHRGSPGAVRFPSTFASFLMPPQYRRDLRWGNSPVSHYASLDFTSELGYLHHPFSATVLGRICLTFGLKCTTSQQKSRISHSSLHSDQKNIPAMSIIDDSEIIIPGHNFAMATCRRPKFWGVCSCDAKRARSRLWFLSGLNPAETVPSIPSIPPSSHFPGTTAPQGTSIENFGVLARTALVRLTLNSSGKPRKTVTGLSTMVYPHGSGVDNSLNG
ncbi:hypothetical protein HYFRA_00011272 [Hymenoscyphus fraxineus]|uniref:Uncharacterized protein n=1 Tax=Hymenoscyphus fraxineus TaxID=746836 RepID=A0A9N9L047_9HELO|nr:hypothetical protein HYFRA_00011272 [Hymenoscyphus fraxineus]